MNVIFYSPESGDIAFTADLPLPDVEANAENSGLSWIEGSAESITHYVDGDELLEKPVQPSPYHVWKNKAWALPEELLAIAKTKAKDRITKLRNTAESSGFTAFGKVFDSDLASIQRISLAVQAAQSTGESFTVDWTCQDNSTIALDYQMMSQLPVIMAQSGSALHVKARTLKGLIDSAGSIEEVDAVQW